VMTTWTETEIAPHMVLTVEHRVRTEEAMAPTESARGIDRTQKDDRAKTQQTWAEPVKERMPRYAAVPFANGWLVIQI